MSKPRKDELLKTPQYRGGMEALKTFVIKNLKYPQEAIDHEIEGAVEVAYDVNGLGQIKNVRILSGLGYGCDEEVIRLVNLLVYEKAINKGKNTLTHKKLKIDFKLPTKTPVAKRTITYHLTKPSEITKKEEPKKVVYSINVNFNKKP